MSANAKIETSQLNDQNLISIAWLVSRYQPFYTYSFGLMMDKLSDQLRHKTNITITVNNKLVAYAGWFETDLQAAQDWQKNDLEALPLPNKGGEAIIVTIVVSQKPEYLRPLIKAISHVCAGKKGFRKRSFGNQRADMIRPPITGRPQKNI
ncbi:hypothetical protein ICN18_08315 [Polynucleobacter sp. Ross1-W9]|uniref:hypothetical protein n=1 Tax=Polynucleobacter parvulilacunae TaxID=1855631 RepID=UPI001C0D346C|nr:hypothetical protein [Polynucleobacter parvulilacunae]MBU3557632.1 hypothetical protein [Polynucleobacter parvulilacunae]